MIAAKDVARQLKQVNCTYDLWGSTEVAALPEILVTGEEIQIAVNGYYEGGFGMLVVTNLRVLVVDKKIFTLNVEDLRYDMITEVTFGSRFVLAKVNISVPTRTVYFTSWSLGRLHLAMRYIQQLVMQARGDHKAPEEHAVEPRAVEEPVFQPFAQTTDSSQTTMTVPTDMLNTASWAEVPPIGERSVEGAVNPYSTLPLARRRRYPIFYQPAG